MSSSLKIQTPHTPRPGQLPAHEHAARKRREGALALPGIPGPNPPRQPKPPAHKGRKTFDTRILSTTF